MFIAVIQDPFHNAKRGDARETATELEECAGFHVQANCIPIELSDFFVRKPQLARLVFNKNSHSHVAV